MTTQDNTVLEITTQAPNPEIALTHEIDAPSWDAFVKGHPYGTPFHLTSWQNTIQSTFGHRPLHIMARDSKGAVVGVLPLFLVRSFLFGRMLVSTPQAAYGGILADSEFVTQTVFTRAREIAQDLNVQFLELRNFRQPVADTSLLQKDLYVTFRQDLQPDPEA